MSETMDLDMLATLALTGLSDSDSREFETDALDATYSAASELGGTFAVSPGNSPSDVSWGDTGSSTAGISPEAVGAAPAINRTFSCGSTTEVSAHATEQWRTPPFNGRCVGVLVLGATRTMCAAGLTVSRGNSGKNHSPALAKRCRNVYCAVCVGTYQPRAAEERRVSNGCCEEWDGVPLDDPIVRRLQFGGTTERSRSGRKSGWRQMRRLMRRALRNLWFIFHTCG